MLYQLVRLPSPAPPPPGGRWEGPPEAAEVPLSLEEASSPLGWGVDDFPPCLGAVVVPLWLEVDGCPPWFEADPCPLPRGAG